MNNKKNLHKMGAMSSKMCHDIISPLTAIEMGTSLLKAEIPEATPTLDLIDEGLAKAVNMVDFFRYAFAFGRDDPLPRKDQFLEYCQKILPKKITISMTHFTAPSSAASYYFRLASCLIYLLKDLAPKGGQLNLTINEGQIDINLEGPMVIFTPSRWKDIIQLAELDTTPHTILPSLIIDLLHIIKRRLTVQDTPTSLHLKIS